MLGKMSGSSAKRRDDGRRSVAVVGSGIAGLSAAYLAHRNGARVTLFEAGETCGGHALTVDSSVGPVDLGFQVRSDRARPPTPSNPRATPRGGDHRRSRRPDPYPPRSMPSAPARVDDRSGPLTVTPRSRPPSPPHPRRPPPRAPCFTTLVSPCNTTHPGPKKCPQKKIPQVFNLTTYPHLVGLFNELGVESEKSDMSFSLSTDSVEWGSLGLSGIFAQKSNAFSPSFLNMIREILRFGKRAPEVLEAKNAERFEGVTLGEYLSKNRYTSFFRENYVVPMCAAIWSCTDRDAMAFPIKTLIRFWVNHHLLNVLERPLWRVVRGRSKAYVDAVVAALPEGTVQCNRRVIRLDRLDESARSKEGGRVRLRFKHTRGAKQEWVDKATFDDVILACHSDQALAILGEDATEAERATLGAVRYQPNEVYLHSDRGLMPQNRAAWASWNCLKGTRGSRDPEKDSVCVTYWVNLLQNLPTDPARSRQMFVTLNPPSPPARDETERHFTLSHPVFDQAAIDAQARVKAECQGLGGVWFAGAWLGYGFHEDGIKSAVDVCSKLFGETSSSGAQAPASVVPVTPWDPRSPKSLTLDWTTRLCVPLFARAAGAWVPPGRAFRIILPDGSEVDAVGKPLPEGADGLGVGVDGLPVPDRVAMTVFDPRVFPNVVLRADIGLGESYMEGHYDADLYQMLDLFCGGHPANQTKRVGDDGATAPGGRVVGADSGVPSLGSDPIGLLGAAAHWLGAKMEFAAHAALSNTREGSKANIEYHYDAGNAFYRLFLDDTMLYSSGIHQPLHLDAVRQCTVGNALHGIDQAEDHVAMEECLEAAQYAKIDAMIARLDLQPNDRVLEIGCGWGACAIRIATRGPPGVKVTGLTISNEQFAEATARVRAAGVADRVEIVMRDYRDVTETYDKVISVEMLEAVGHEHLPGFFAVVSRALRPRGVAAIQVITMPDERYESYCKSESDFIRAYIFPGGHLPSVGAMTQAATPAGLSLDSFHDIGHHYAVTLRLWRVRMMNRRREVLGLGYSLKFLRMFEFYFAYCEAGFARGLINDLQMTWVKEREVDGATLNRAVIRGDEGATLVAEKDAKDARRARTVASASVAAFVAVASRDALDATDLFTSEFRTVASNAAFLRASAPIALALAAVAVHFFALVFVAAFVAVVDVVTKNPGAKKKGNAVNREGLVGRAAKTATPAANCVVFALIAAAAVARTAREVSNARSAGGGVIEVLYAIAAKETTAGGDDREGNNALGSIVPAVPAWLPAAAAGSTFLFSLLARAVFGPGDASVASARGGVTASSHKRERSAVDLAALLLCHFAASTNTYLAPVALAATSFFSSACDAFAAAAEAASGFPRGDDSLLRRVSHPLATLAGVVFRVSPHVVLFSASFATFARDVGGGAAERWNARDALEGAAAPALAAFAAASSVAALAQATQERRAARAVRERVIKMATSAEV